MAQTKHKRQTKHRGNAAGVIEARGRTGRRSATADHKQSSARQARPQRGTRPPSWKTASVRSGIMGFVLLVFLYLVDRNKPGVHLLDLVLMCAVAVAFYIPAGYYWDRYLYQRNLKRQRGRGAQGRGK
jgi:hypothetical protein